jgi:hypothetical protein
MDNLIPACGGMEKPFTVNGVRWLYCWQPETNRHCYLNLDTDVAVFHRSFHPAFAPEFEFEEDVDVVAVQNEAKAKADAKESAVAAVQQFYF